MRQIYSWFKISLLATIFTLSSLGVSAQTMEIPLDPNVRMGKLENGLTYYIRKNAKPAERADFYIAQKVGSIQEEPAQRGLAHFLEHMCFNGTTHFPGNSLIKYLENIGVKFGENLNAYTSIEETVYNISNVPVLREGAIDSCLYILHDWSNDLLLEPEEIDKERGVITEEWRTTTNANQRYADGLLKKFMKGTKYEDCLPIGSMEVVNGFEYQTLRDYYEKWYRPDLQGIVIVGDIDVDEIENRIKTIFSDIPAQPDAAERVYYTIGDNVEPLVHIYQDKEQPNIMFNIFNKHAAVPREAKGDVSYMVQDYAVSMITSMFNSRVQELLEQSNPPFIYAGVYDGPFLVTSAKGAFTGVAVCKEDDVKGSIQALLDEVARMRQHGFTPSEYARARASYLSGLESAYNERDKNKNVSFVNEYVRHFLDNEPAPGIEFEYSIMSQIANSIPVEAINQLIPELLPENNKAMTIFAPEKEGLVLPTEAELVEMLNATLTKEFEPYEDEVSDEPLLSEELEGGKIVKEEKNTKFDTTTLTLSNGVKVVIKPTDFKADQILMSASSWGGTSQFDNAEFVNFSNIELATVGGIGNFSNVDLGKVLAGKIATVKTSVNYLSENVSGYCAPKDFETLLQLTYLNFTSPRKDVDAFQSNINRSKALLKNAEMDPNTALRDSVSVALYNNHPRARSLHADDLDQVNYDRVIEMYKERFADASDFTFILVGNIDVEASKPLIEKYLGSLPALYRNESFIDRKMYNRKGLYHNEFIRQQDNPKATTLVAFNGDVEYTRKNDILMSMLNQIMTLVYTEKVREDEGGTYGVGVWGSLSRLPIETGSFIIQFDTDPNKHSKLMEIIYKELETVCSDGPSAVNLNKVKENMLKKQKEMLNENGFWNSAINMYLNSGIDYVTGYDELVSAITGDEIRDFAKQFFSQENKAEVVMISPEK